MTLTRVRILSPNYSSRGGAKVRLIVLHTSEGATTFTSLGSYFSNPNSQVSSHVGIDDTVNTVGEYVDRGAKAWTAGNANPVAVQAELCTPSGGYLWTDAQWRTHTNMLTNAAQWIKEESAAFGIPIVKLNASQAQGTGVGICQHRDLGSWGGGHIDCGDGFPIDYVLSLAGGGQPVAPPITPGVPPLHVDYFGQTHNSTVPDVMLWQERMLIRGWLISVDGIYGPKSDSICHQFQAEKGLTVDGLVGPDTWAATWNSPIT